MAGWECGIAGCAATYGDVTELLAHQVTEHERHECRVCGAVVPAGFFAIQHCFDEHTRADYVRTYDAGSDDIRVREDVKAAVEADVDIDSLRDRLGLDPDASV